MYRLVIINMYILEIIKTRTHNTNTQPQFCCTSRMVWSSVFFSKFTKADMVSTLQKPSPCSVLCKCYSIYVQELWMDMIRRI